MSDSLWSSVDDYFTAALAPEAAALAPVLANNARADLPAIDVSPLQGKLLHLLAGIQGARRILEIGTLGGYSTIWLARALPRDGRLVTLELNPVHAAAARENLRAGGVEHQVEVRVGPAAESLQAMVTAGEPAFDFVFIDADKAGMPEYFTRALELARPGTVIVADNVVRNGAVLDAGSEDANIRGVRGLADLLANEPRVEATAIQTVGVKGYDGFVLARVKEPLPREDVRD